jgi:hypothetical protein
VAAANGARQSAAARNAIADCSFIDDAPLRLPPPAGCNPIAP